MDTSYLSVNYWFNARPEPLAGTSMDIMLGIATLLFLVGIIGVIGLMKKYGVSRKKNSQLISFAFTNACISLAFAFFSYEIIPYFRARILYILWAIIMIIWLWKILFPKHDHPHHTTTIDSDREKEIKKYLPS